MGVSQTGTQAPEEMVFADERLDDEGCVHGYSIIDKHPARNGQMIRSLENTDVCSSIELAHLFPNFRVAHLVDCQLKWVEGVDTYRVVLGGD